MLPAAFATTCFHCFLPVMCCESNVPQSNNAEGEREVCVCVCGNEPTLTVSKFSSPNSLPSSLSLSLCLFIVHRSVVELPMRRTPQLQSGGGERSNDGSSPSPPPPRPSASSAAQTAHGQYPCAWLSLGRAEADTSSTKPSQAQLSHHPCYNHHDHHHRALPSALQWQQVQPQGPSAGHMAVVRQATASARWVQSQATCTSAAKHQCHQHHSHHSSLLQQHRSVIAGFSSNVPSRIPLASTLHSLPRLPRLQEQRLGAHHRPSLIARTKIAASPVNQTVQTGMSASQATHSTSSLKQEHSQEAPEQQQQQSRHAQGEEESMDSTNCSAPLDDDTLFEHRKTKLWIHFIAGGKHRQHHTCLFVRHTHTHTLTHSLTHSLSLTHTHTPHTLTHTHSLTHSLTDTLTHSLTH